MGEVCLRADQRHSRAVDASRRARAIDSISSYRERVSIFNFDFKFEIGFRNRLECHTDFCRNLTERSGEPSFANDYRDSVFSSP